MVLVGDSLLGGIGTTISAFESLHIRGYDVDAVALFEDKRLENHSYLRDHFAKHGISTFCVPKPPLRPTDDPVSDQVAMTDYYEQTSQLPDITRLCEHLHHKHADRISSLSSMSARARNIIWHPFTQHGLPSSSKILAIDSAYGDHFETLDLEAESKLDPSRSAQSISQSQPLSKQLFDSSASWWTQGLGHGNPDLSLAAAYAAGRYGHVMFASAVHAPALDLSETLLRQLDNPRLRRVFFTDNGSTGMEVAVKMALRATCVRYGWEKEEGVVGVLGLKGSYHGDTIGVMNCSEPNIFNKKVDWHQPWGWWFDPPSVRLHKGLWVVDIPGSMHSIPDKPGRKRSYKKLEDVFDFTARADTEGQGYKDYILHTLLRLVRDEGRRFGALIMEPILMGAGGMIFVDPLFQRTLIQVVREYPGIFQNGEQNNDTTETDDKHSWSGLPIIADEVFTGLYRLGRLSSFSFLTDPNDEASPTSIAPDISVHAKLLTGGLLPLAITTASDSIFKAFLSDKKQDALLHGHSYTAHAIGCTVSQKSLTEMERMSTSGTWDGYKAAWKKPDRASTPPLDLDQEAEEPKKEIIHGNGADARLWSFWSHDFIHTLSYSPSLSGVTALGTVLVLHLYDEDSGYSSNAAVDLQTSLQETKNLRTSNPSEETGGDVVVDPDHSDIGVHSRVLGNVLYLMASLTSKPVDIGRIERKLLRLLC